MSVFRGSTFALSCVFRVKGNRTEQNRTADPTKGQPKLRPIQMLHCHRHFKPHSSASNELPL